MKQAIGPVLPGTKQVLLSFSEALRRPRDVGGRSVDTYCEQIQIPFLPKGLIVWGTDDSTMVHSIKVGNISEAEIGGCAPIPGRYFEQGRSFEEIQRLAEAGELDVSLEARQQLDMTEAFPGGMVSIAISGSYERLCMWGVTYANGRPHRKASVQLLESGGYCGRVDEVGLSGIRTVLDVTAPDVKAVTELLVGLQPYSARY